MLCLVFILVCVMVVISILLTIMMSQVYVGKFKNSKGAIKILKTGSDAVLKYILLNF